MLPEIDKALVTLLSSQTYANERVKVDLDPPTKDWAARRTGPVLNLFLNDIREDTERRTADIIDVKDDKGVIVARRPAERLFVPHPLSPCAGRVRRRAAGTRREGRRRSRSRLLLPGHCR